MPFINIRTAPGNLSDAEATQLIDRTTALMRDIMKKKAERTTVFIEPADATLWAVGGTLISDRGGRAVFMDIKITQGTNTTTEKEAMVEESHRMLTEVLGAIPEATYIKIDEISGESWGKAGHLVYEKAAIDRAAERAQGQEAAGD